MKSLTIFLFSFALLTAQTGSITNVTASQRTDGSQIVDIYYDLNGSQSDYYIAVEVSYDDGNTFDQIYFLSGDYGFFIEPGINKHIIWHFGLEYPHVYNDDTRIKVSAVSGYIDNIGWVIVPLGQFTYGEGDNLQSIDYTFEIMKYEVTNYQYMIFLQQAYDEGLITITNIETVTGYLDGNDDFSDGTYTYLDFGSDYCKINFFMDQFFVEPNFADHPVVRVTWYGAWAFAQYFGWDLPTEQEWEKAARWNTGWDYPWGSSIDGSRANYINSGDPYDNGTTPVGYYNGESYDGFQTTDSPSPVGAYDMAGNVWEWTNSWYNGSNRVVRGGSWSYDTSNLLSWHRANNSPTSSNSNIGFRCSRTQ